MEEVTMQGGANASGEMLKPYYLQRGCAAAIAGMAWFGLVVQLCFNIEEALIKNLSVPARMFAFFSYFTIEINLLIAIVLTIFLTQPQAEHFLNRPSIKSALVVYIIIVGVVYAVLLRNLWNPQRLRLLADRVLHDAIPVLYPLYWLVFLPKGSLRWSNSVTWLLYPVLFFFYSMVRGAVFGTYSYPFLNAAELGFARVSLNATVLLGVFFGLGVALTAIDHALGSGERERSGLGRAAEL
jgi:hypothetical protein